MTSEVRTAGAAETADIAGAAGSAGVAAAAEIGTTGDRTVAIGDSRFVFEPHNCFACGTLNADGLGLVLHMEPGRSWTETTLDRRFEGWEGIAHGGILSTILDEVMAWALVSEDHWGVTARMSVAFRRPVRIGTPIRAEGWMTSSRGRIIETAARIVDAADGTELATGEGSYVAAGIEKKRELMARYGFRDTAKAPGDETGR